nr:hypothetical protein [uncultured Aminipila sp.]
MIESIGSSITDYAKQERELLANKENSVKSAETSQAAASSDAAAIATSEQQVSDTAQVKTRAPQYDTVEISEEGMQMAKQQANSDSAVLNSSAATDEQDSDNSAVTSDEMINVSGQTAMEDQE